MNNLRIVQDLYDAFWSQGPLVGPASLDRASQSLFVLSSTKTTSRG